MGAKQMDAVEGRLWGNGHAGTVGAAQAPRAGLVAKAVLWVIKEPHPATHSHHSSIKLKKKTKKLISYCFNPKPALWLVQAGKQQNAASGFSCFVNGAYTFGLPHACGAQQRVFLFCATSEEKLWR